MRQRRPLRPSFYEHVSYLPTEKLVLFLHPWFSETRRTYRAILSEPRIVIPEGFATSLPSGSQGQSAPTGSVPVEQPAHAEPSSTEIAGDGHELPAPAPAPQPPSKSTNGKKRALEEDTGSTLRPTGSQSKNPGQAEGASKKKRKKNQPKETVG